MRGGIAVVTFDGDETLWDFQNAMRGALEATARSFAEAGLARSGGTPVTADWLAELRTRVAVRPEWQMARMEAIRLESLREAAARTAAPTGFAEEVFDRYMELRHSGVRLYPETRASLQSLADRGLRTALITNGNSDPSLLGLDALLETTVVAADCGFRKPDPAIYRHAAGRLDVSPEACVHVGDHPMEDVRASAEAGMRPVWINRTGMTWPGGVRPWREITTLADLPPLLD
ncbi:HAD family hydrolase [Actinomadura sp. 6K520]|uniref:HAD family hydrolase n=1 Tax=Actinomadura sp. 6K520 TaxID=2530364 RepID=UPI001050FB94|nr:HAD family hydrolase [Actinomadura sp. 6K520]TDE23926.1 HAD family hydrolase [Actinomadura sp. 6K520]